MSDVVTGLVCAVCATTVPISQALSWKCPRATEIDTHHVLHFENTVEPFRPTDDENPYLAFRKYLAVDSFGAAIGLSEDERIRIITEANAAVAAVAAEAPHAGLIFARGARMLNRVPKSQFCGAQKHAVEAV